MKLDSIGGSLSKLLSRLQHMCRIQRIPTPPLAQDALSYSLRHTKPSMEHRNENLLFPRGLVQMSATLSVEAMGRSLIEPSDIQSCTKWWQTSMCLVLLCMMGFFMSDCSPRLSMKTVVG